MNFIWDRIVDWLKELLVGGIMSNLSGLFDGLNDKVREIAGTVGSTPQGWNSGVFNMVRSLFALGFQAFLIILCVAIYAVLIQTITVGTDVIAAIWTCVGYTVLLCFTLFKTSSLSRAIFAAH